MGSVETGMLCVILANLSDLDGRDIHRRREAKCRQKMCSPINTYVGRPRRHSALAQRQN